MRELTNEEMKQVSGGQLSWKEGAGLILTASAFAPATVFFAAPIAGAMLYIDYKTNG